MPWCLQRIGTALVVLALLAGCRLAGTNAGGYITGDGQVTAWDREDRGAPVTYDGGSPDGRALLAFRHLPRSTPTTVVLDAQGRVSATVSGAITSELLVSELVACAASDDSSRCSLHH